MSTVPRPVTTAAVRAGAAAALALAVACGGAHEAGGDHERGAGGDRPNVLLISIDSLRADHLGSYGYARDTSPVIDRLAAEGALFESAVSTTSWTLPSHASLFSALPSSVHGLDRNTRILAPEVRTVAEAFFRGGYTTAGFWSGPYLDPRFGVGQGFEVYRSCARYAQPEEVRAVAQADVTSPRIVQNVGAWLGGARDRDRPFFLFVHMWDVHYDFVPPPPYDTLFDPDYAGDVDGTGLHELHDIGDLEPRDVEHLRALYDGEIAWTDRHIGELLDLLVQQGLADDTIVVVTSDHGEEFFEHAFFGHHKNLYDSSIRIPLVVWAPGRVPPGARVERLARLEDVAPTLLDLAGLPALPDTLGRSLVPLIQGRATSESTVAIGELHRRVEDDILLSVRTGRFKYLAIKETGEPQELYDLASDPGEQRDLLGVDDELHAEAQERFDAAVRYLQVLGERQESFTSESDATLPADLEQELRSLGYLGDDG